MSQVGRISCIETLNAFSHLPIALISLYEINSGNPNKVFLVFSFLTFFFSFLYHITHKRSLKVIFRRLDVASIFWLVPASVFHFLPSVAAISILSLCVALSVPVIKSGASTVFTDVALVTLALACLMLTFVFSTGWREVTLGAAFYGFGLPFYFNDEQKWSHFVWHVFVITGWTIHLWAHL